MKRGGHLTKTRLQILGKVQGVFYRQSALEVAKLLGLNGWIKNNPDGSVEAEVIGSEEAIERFAEWCRQGPPRAVVDEVLVLSREEPDSSLETAVLIGFRIIG
jgi:acylphosphatase